MGCAPSFPLVFRPIAYEPQGRFTDTGQYVGVANDGPANNQLSFFHVLNKEFWEEFIGERQRRTKAKENFKNMDLKEIRNMFPQWDDEEIHDLKTRFQMLDLNADGLLDENEINHILNELGDKSSPEERKRKFREIDTDGSDGVDFVEFLEVISLCQAEAMKDGYNVGQMFARGFKGSVHLVTKLSAKEQMAKGVF
eukprot:m.312004 g.312004  ORF g.312004 m.312004 type:complete len:196 (+) comp196175_c0_seq1:138-725(+)